MSFAVYEKPDCWDFHVSVAQRRFGAASVSFLKPEACHRPTDCSACARRLFRRGQAILSIRYLLNVLACQSFLRHVAKQMNQLGVEDHMAHVEINWAN